MKNYMALKKIVLFVSMVIIILHSVFAEEIRFDFNDPVNIIYDPEKAEMNNGKIKLSHTGFWTNTAEAALNLAHWPRYLFQDSYKTIFYLSTPGALAGFNYMSTNYGGTFSFVSTGPCGHMIESHNSVLYMAGYQGTPNTCIYKSTNHGQDWFIIRNADFLHFTLLETRNNAILCAGRRSSNPATNRVLLSTNEGQNWETISIGTNTPLIYNLFELTNNRIIGQSTNGLYLSTNAGTNWNYINGTGDLFASEINNFIKGGFFKASDNSFYVFGNSIGRSWDYGNTWSTISQEESYSLIQASDGLFYKTYKSNVWKSFDEGYTWQKASLIYKNNTNCHDLGRGLIEADDGHIYTGAGFGGLSSGYLFRNGYPNQAEIIISIIPSIAVNKWLSFSRSDILNGGTIIYEFSYSSDKGLTYSDWMPLTDMNLNNVPCKANGDDWLKVRITLYSLNHEVTPEIDWINLKYDNGNSTTLRDVVIAPNPFVPYKNPSKHVTIFNLSENFEMNVYSTDGGEVVHLKDRAMAGRYQWYIKNNKGEDLKSGTYFCHIRDNQGNERDLKLVIIR